MSGDDKPAVPAASTVEQAATGPRPQHRHRRRRRPTVTVDWPGLIAAVRQVDPSADPGLVLAAAQAVRRPSHQRAAVAAVAADPDLLRGRGAAAAVAGVLQLIDRLIAAGVPGLARAACPRCGRVVALVKWHDGARICARCDKQVRAAPCARCGVQREVHTRDANGQPLCSSCDRRDPGKAEQCVRCGRMRPVNNRTPQGPRCASCRTFTQGVCGLCGRMAPCTRSVVSGLSRCRLCAARRARCGGCGQVGPVHSGTREDPRCAVCTVPGPNVLPRKWQACPSCGQKSPSTRVCASCCLVALVQPLLTAGDQVRPELQPLLAWWDTVDQPASVRTWLSRRPAARALLRALADGTVPISHEGLDQLDDSKTVQYVRRVLVSCGVLPAHDDLLDRLQRWLQNTLADIEDPQHRRIMHRYAHWHHLRRLRARVGPDSSVTAGQAQNLRNLIRGAAAVLAELAASGRTLADLRPADIDTWLADGQVARRAELGAFLRWGHRERLTTIDLPVPQWPGPHDRIDHDQRWAQARRLLHDDTLPAEDRVAGLLVVLYAQTATSIRTLRFDQLETTPDGARLVFGTTPIDLPPIVAALISKLAADRAGTQRAASPWVFPGRPWTQPINPEQLRKRLAESGTPARATRTTALFQLAIELPAAVLARCLGIDIRTAVAWQRATAGDWHAYAARVGPSAVTPKGPAAG